MSNSIALAEEEQILKLKPRSFGQNLASVLDNFVNRVRARYGIGLQTNDYQHVFVILRVGLQRLIVRKI